MFTGDTPAVMAVVVHITAAANAIVAVGSNMEVKLAETLIVGAAMSAFVGTTDVTIVVVASTSAEAMMGS